MMKLPHDPDLSNFVPHDEPSCMIIAAQPSTRPLTPSVLLRTPPVFLHSAPCSSIPCALPLTPHASSACTPKPIFVLPCGSLSRGLTQTLNLKTLTLSLSPSFSLQTPLLPLPSSLSTFLPPLPSLLLLVQVLIFGFFFSWKLNNGQNE